MTTLRQLSLALFAAVLCCVPPAHSQSESSVRQELSGLAIMQAINRRHRQYPYSYEKLTMILTDRTGHQETRQLSLYTRFDPEFGARYLLRFELPLDVSGTAILSEKQSNGESKQYIYLPALGEILIETEGGSTRSSLLGSDFSLEDFAGSSLEGHEFRRRRDTQFGKQSLYVVDVYERDTPSRTAESLICRHFISKDNLFIVRTDYLDRDGNLRKRQSYYDPVAVLGDALRPNMILMQDAVQEHQTLVKVDQRILSRDYVPDSLFTPEWLFEQTRTHGSEQSESESPERGGEPTEIEQTSSS